MEIRDSIVKSIVEKFIERSNLGIQKYGTTLDRNDLKTIDWINHAQEELMDGILYLEKLKQVELVREAPPLKQTYNLETYKDLFETSIINKDLQP